MIDERFVFLAAGCNLLGSASYVVATLRGRTKPNRVTWSMWALAPFIAFAAEMGEGVGLRSLMTFMVGFSPLLVLISSFVNRDAYWKLIRFDLGCGALSLVAIVAWRVTGSGVVAVVFSLVADLLAGIPTVVKAYREPSTEDATVFIFGTISAAITLLTVDEWTIAAYGFPAYIAGMGVLLTVLISFPAMRFGSAAPGAARQSPSP